MLVCLGDKSCVFKSHFFTINIHVIVYTYYLLVPESDALAKIEVDEMFSDVKKNASKDKKK